MIIEKWADISWWQQKIDWLRLKDDVDGVCIKVIEGNWQDQLWRQYLAAARKVGLKVQYYGFYRQWITGQKQAELLWSLIKDDPGDLPPVIDAEAGIPEASPANVASSLKKYAEVMKALDKRKPWIYTGKGFMLKLLGGCWLPSSREARVGWMREYPLFLAQYRWANQKNFVRDYLIYEALALNPSSKPKPIFPWNDVTAWQFTGNGRLDGISTSADVDIYYYQ
jgi:lysozyme